MTVLTQLRRTTLSWTGAETSFAAGFPADQVADVSVLFRDAAGVETTLAQGIDYSATLASGTKIVTVTPISLPAPPASLTILRLTPALVKDVLRDGEDFPASVHQALHDRGAMRDAEIRDDGTRSLVLSATSSAGSGEYLAGGNRIRNVADPILAGDVATRGWTLDQLGDFPTAAAEIRADMMTAASLATSAASVLQLVNEPLDDGNQADTGASTFYDDGTQGT